MAQRYKTEITRLTQALKANEGYGEAKEHVRALIDKITLTANRRPEKPFCRPVWRFSRDIRVG